MRGKVEALRFSGAGLLFAGSVLCALLAAGTVFSYMHAAVKTEEVLVLARDLPPGATVTADDVKVKQVPAGSAPSGAILVADRSKLTGQRLRYGVPADSVLQYSHIVKKGSYVTSQVAELGDDYRAIGLSVEMVPGVQRLALGDKLELTGVLNSSNTVVTVPLGTVQVIDLPRDDKNDRGQILVAAKADQAAQIALIMRGGTVSVSVIGHDKQPAPVPPMRLDNLVGANGAQPSPAKAAAPTK